MSNAKSITPIIVLGMFKTAPGSASAQKSIHCAVASEQPCFHYSYELLYKETADSCELIQYLNNQHLGSETAEFTIRIIVCQQIIYEMETKFFGRIETTLLGPIIQTASSSIVQMLGEQGLTCQGVVDASG